MGGREQVGENIMQRKTTNGGGISTSSAAQGRLEIAQRSKF